MDATATTRDVRITVARVARYDDLIAAYEAWEPDPCTMREGMVFLARGGARPEGLCDSAWETLEPFVAALLGILVYHEAVTPFKLLGMAAIFGAILLLNRSPQKNS